MDSLILITKGMERVVCPLGNAMMLIGRDPNSGIYLQDNEVSMNHASIVFQNGQYVIRDNGSRNGTYVNGEKATSRILAHNDQIVFGPYAFLVDLQSRSDLKSTTSISKMHVARGGRSYRSSVTLPQPRGTANAQTVHVMMSGKVPQHKPHEPTQKTWNRPIVFGFVATSVLAIAASLAWSAEGKKTASAFKKQQQAEAKIIELSSSLAKGAEDILSLQLKLEDANKKLEQASSEVKNLQTSLMPPPESPSVDAEPTPDPVAVAVPVATDHAASAAMLGIEPFQPDPLLTFPTELTLQSDVAIPVVLGPNVTATRKVPSGTSFLVKSASQDTVEVDFNGHNVSLRKEQTDFTNKLDAANAQISQANARKYDEWKIRVEAALQAHTEGAAAQAVLEAEKRPISLIVQNSLPKGLLGRTPNGVMAYVTGIDSSLAIGERWKGDAYPLGLYVASPDSNTKYRHYTTNIEEFKNFKKSGSPEISSTYSEAAPALKEPEKIPFLKLQELYNLSNPLGTLETLKNIFNSKHPTFEVELDQYCRGESKKWEDVAAMAKDLIRVYSSDSMQRRWLKQVVLCSEMCIPERVDIFKEQLKILDKNWLDIKMRHSIYQEK